MKKLFLFILLLQVACLQIYSQQKAKNVSTKETTSAKKSKIRYGTASFYAKKFNGRRTANGEMYSSSKYSAACNVLPLNTWIRVTNLLNKKSVVVKINDRLHPKNKRIVDLSTVAAKKLGYTGRGLTRVKVEVVNKSEFAATL